MEIEAYVKEYLQCPEKDLGMFLVSCASRMLQEANELARLRNATSDDDLEAIFTEQEKKWKEFVSRTREGVNGQLDEMFAKTVSVIGIGRANVSMISGLASCLQSS